MKGPPPYGAAMSRLAPLLRDLYNRLPARGKTGVAPTGVPGVTFFWISRPIPRAPLIHSAGVVILGQGHKVGRQPSTRSSTGCCGARRGTCFTTSRNTTRQRAEAELEAGIREIRRTAFEVKGVWEAAAVRGGLEVMTARLEWVRSLREL